MAESDEQFVERIIRLYGETQIVFRQDVHRLFDLARRGAAVQWRPISEAPKDGTWMLVSAPGEEPETACWISSVWLTGWYSGGGRSDSYPPSFSPTHWMPLPPPPAGEQE